MELQNINYTQISMKHEALETHVAKIDGQNQAKTLEYAKTMAEEGKPRNGENLQKYKSIIHSWYESLWQHVKKELQSQEFEQLNQHDTDFVENKIKENGDKRAKKVHERQSHLIESNRILLTFNPKTTKIVIAVLVLIGLFAGIVDGRSLMIGLRENFIISMIWGLLLGLSISMLSKTMPRVVREWCKTLWQQRFAILASIAIVAGITFLIGSFRTGSAGALQITGAAESEVTNASPLTFMVFNTFVYFVELIMCFFFLPTKEQNLRWIAKKDHLKKVEDLDKEILEIENANESLKDQLNTIVKGRKQNNYYEQYLFDYIKSLAGQAWTLFISENQIRRNDNYSPEEGNEEVYQSIFNKNKKTK